MFKSIPSFWQMVCERLPAAKQKLVSAMKIAHRDVGGPRRSSLALRTGEWGVRGLCTPGSTKCAMGILFLFMHTNGPRRQRVVLSGITFQGMVGTYRIGAVGCSHGECSYFRFDRAQEIDFFSVDRRNLVDKLRPGAHRMARASSGIPLGPMLT
jgi:hypothetical protein